MPRTLRIPSPIARSCLLAALLIVVAARPAWTASSSIDGDEDDNLSPRALTREMSVGLPHGWRLTAPAEELGRRQSTLTLPPSWRGNAHAAAMLACPGPESSVWHEGEPLWIVTRQGRRSLPPWRCDPP